MGNLDGGSPNEAVTETEVVQPETPSVEDTPAEEIDYKKAYEGLQKKVGKLTARNYDLANGQKEILDRLEQYNKVEEPAKTRTDFDNDDDYVNYLADKRIETVLHERDAQGKLEYQKQLEAEAQERAWAEKMQSAKGRYSDFEQALNTAEVPITPEVVEAVKKSEVGGDIVYAMAKDPAFAQKLTQLPKEQLDREILKKEIMLQMPSPQITNAPQATPEVRGESHLVTDRSNETTAEFIARRNRELGRT
jgi:hypothetical protein